MINTIHIAGCRFQTRTRQSQSCHLLDAANGPITEQVQRVCYDTLPWLISFSLGLMPASVTARPKINRPISAEEVAVIHSALERAPTRPIPPEVIESVGRLHAIAKCGCGCESVDFAPHDPANPSSHIGDGIGTTSQGEEVGTHRSGADRMRSLDSRFMLSRERVTSFLHLPETIHGWDRQTT